jgi:hypothetical protein
MRRVQRRMCTAPELLEDRVVMSAGQGSTFAIMPGSITSVGEISSVNFVISPTLFTAPKGKFVMGIDIAPASSSSSSTTSTLKPEIMSVTSSSGQVIHVEHSRYNAKVAKANKLGDAPTSASLVTLKVPKTGQAAANYTVQVKGLDLTTGTYLIGFYLPGDVAGTGTVTLADIQTIHKDKGMTAENANYNFNADTNRDGIINGQDLKIAKQNVGVSTLVSPTISVNLNPASDPSENRTTPYSTVNFAGTLTPNATVTFVDNSGGGTTTATADSTGAYNINVPLVSGSNTFTVTTQDAFGQSISGAIQPVVYDPPTS